MGDVEAFVLAIVAMLISVGLLLGRINYKIDKFKGEVNDIYVGKENAAAAVRVLEGLIRNLNAVCQDHQKRLDILEADHPDTDIDYGEVDDQGEVVCVWFEGKKYVPEDKSAEETSTFYADNKVVAETTRPEETRCCATCQYYRPESGFSTCGLRTWKKVSKEYANNIHSACNNWEKVYTPTKGQVDYPYIAYENMSGNCKVEALQKSIVKLNYLASDAECDELLKRVERLNRIYDAGLMSLSEYGDRLKEWMQNDS